MLQRLAKVPRNLPAFCLLSALLALSLTGAQSGSVDYDTDDDGLIEITYLEQLSAVRYDLGGHGKIDESILYSEDDTRKAKPESTDGRREGQASWDEGVAGEAAWAPWGRM